MYVIYSVLNIVTVGVLECRCTHILTINVQGYITTSHPHDTQDDIFALDLAVHFEVPSNFYSARDCGIG